MTPTELAEVIERALTQAGRRIVAVLLAGIALPVFILGYAVGGLAIGAGKGVEAWQADVKQYWKEWHL